MPLVSEMKESEFLMCSAEKNVLFIVQFFMQISIHTIPFSVGSCNFFFRPRPVEELDIYLHILEIISTCEKGVEALCKYSVSFQYIFSKWCTQAM